jgi:hypothetical protein
MRPSEISSTTRCIIGFIVGLIVFVAIPETARRINGGAFAQSSASPPSVQQNNQGAPNLNVPGSNNQFNFYTPPPQRSKDDRGDVYQAGIVVGKAFGARRSPTDATAYTFVEITHASQLDMGAPIEFNGLILRIKLVNMKSGVTSNRPEEGTIYEGVTAVIIGQKP